ncbi:unnamed protein product [Gulo gulo]|uniref:Uncharacterized protein n=1 Tax=Gulo gulo TaxID=48420 RepID=A0A9X9PW80_GULGU|nr:unnamed protein product [Gulo gulo]
MQVTNAALRSGAPEQGPRPVLLTRARQDGLWAFSPSESPEYRPSQGRRWKWRAGTKSPLDSGRLDLMGQSRTLGANSPRKDMVTFAFVKVGMFSQSICNLIW